MKEEKPAYSIPKILILCVVYVLTGRLGLMIRPVFEFATLVWPPAGISLAALLIWGYRVWPASAVGAFLVNLLTGAHPLAAAGIALGNTLEAVAGALVLQRVFGFRNSLERLRDVLALVLTAVVLSTPLSAGIGTLSLWLTGKLSSNDVPATGLAWWAGDALSDLVVAPFVLTWATRAGLGPVSPRRALEAGVLSSLLVLICAAVFGGKLIDGVPIYALAYLVFPLLIWAAFRFGQRGAITANLAVSAFAIWGTVRGIGPFAKTEVVYGLYLLELFQGVVAVTVMILGAAISERRTEKEALLEARGRSEEQLRIMLQGVSDYAIFMLDPAGYVRTWNLGAERIKGYAASEVLGEHFSLFYPKEEVEAGRPAFALEVAAALGRFEEEGWRIRKDGTRFWANGLITALRDEQGRLLGFSKITRDLSERKHAEDELRASYATLEKRVQERTSELEKANRSLKQSEVQKSAVFRAAIDGIISIDHQGRIIDFNPAAERMFGYERAKVVGREMTDLIVPPRLRGECCRGIGRFLETGENRVLGRRVEMPAMRSDGSEFPAELSLLAIRTDSLPIFTGFVRDISNRKILEHVTTELGKTLDYDSTIQRATELMVPAVCDGCVVYVLENGNIQLKAVSHVDPRKRESTRETLMTLPCRLTDARGAGHVLATGRSELYRSGDQDLPELIRVLGASACLFVPLQAHGHVFGAMAYLYVDEAGRLGEPENHWLAEELAARAGLAIDNAHLFMESQKAIDLRDEFMSIASHEMKTPLTPLKMQLEIIQRLLQQGGAALLPKGETILKVAQTSDQQIDRLSRLINDLLDVSRISTGKLSLNLEEVELPGLVREVANRFQPEVDRARSRLELIAEGPATGRWDRLRIEQVVINLLTNALKYGAGKPIEIRVSQSGDAARLIVRDHGIGIRPEDQNRIFKRFERAAALRSFAGLGLGLYITRQIVEAHGGSIRVESEVGAGSTFIVEIPLAVPVAERKAA